MYLNIFSITFFFVYILSFFLRYIKEGKKIFCIISGICYFLIAALRSWDVGGDSFNYVWMFEFLANENIEVAFNFTEKDPFFYVLLSILGKFTSNYTVLFIIVAGFFTISIWYFIYRYSKDPMLSIIILLAMNLYQFSLAGMRQTITISFIVWAIIALDRNKIKTAILYIFLGSLFHKSGLIFLVIILMKNLNINIKIRKASIIILVFCFLFRGTMVNFFISFINERGYEIATTTNGITMTFVIFILYIISIIFIEEYAKYDKRRYLQYDIAFWAVFFQLLVTVQNIFFRIAFYFLIIYIVLIPNVLVNIKNRNSKMIVKNTLHVLLIIQYLMFTMGSGHILPYTTYWQI